MDVWDAGVCGRLKRDFYLSSPGDIMKASKNKPEESAKSSDHTLKTQKIRLFIPQIPKNNGIDLQVSDPSSGRMNEMQLQ